MEKLILGLICTIVSPFIIWNSFQNWRKFEADYRSSKKLNPESDYYGGPNIGQLILSVIGFFMGLYLLTKYFSSS